MARKPSDKNIEAPQELPQEVAQTLADSVTTVAALQATYSDERDTLNQMIGQVQMGRAFAKFADVVSLSKIAHIKETRMYKALAGKKGVDLDGNEIADVGTWEGFCLAIGTTRQKVDEDLLNLKTFGEEAMADLSRIGAGYREMRQLRKLPDDEKNALLEAAKTGDKDTFLDLAEEIVARNARKEEQLSLELNEAKAALEAKDAVAQNNARRINELQEKAVLLQKQPADEKAKQLCAEIAAQQSGIDQEIRTNFYNALQTLVDHGGDDHQGFINAQIQMLHDAVKLLSDEFGGAGVAWEEQ